MVAVHKDKVVLEELIIDDPDVVRIVSSIEGDDERADTEARSDFVIRALKIGALALERTQTRVDVDVVRNEFETFNQQVEQALNEIFKEDNGRLAMVLQEYLGEGGKLQDLFDPQRKDSAIARIQQIFDEHFSGNGAKFVKMLDYTEESSPLRKLQQAFDNRFEELNKQLVELQKQLAKEEGREEEYALGTRKGVDFESIVKDILDRPARVYRDAVTHVGLEAEASGSKTGDLLINISPDDTGGREDIRIVVETKRQRNMGIGGKTGILQELERAMKARRAQYGLAVFSEDACPAEVGRLRSYPGNRIVCSVDPTGEDGFILEAGYQIARTELCWQLRQDHGDIDRATVEDGLARAKEKLGQFQGLKAKATELGKLSSSIRAQLDEIEQSVIAELNAIANQL
ncbi:MAG: hypothetical protein R3300_02945 [Candidatus Promineifilaceae bacterium]|nr:hypothetical protein [Candidatus Promineifilaceae bacterium]